MQSYIFQIWEIKLLNTVKETTLSKSKYSCCGCTFEGIKLNKWDSWKCLACFALLSVLQSVCVSEASKSAQSSNYRDKQSEVFMRFTLNLKSA